MKTRLCKIPENRGDVIKDNNLSKIIYKKATIGSGRAFIKF